MTHNSNRCNAPMQKAGQAVGTAHANQPFPRNRSSRFRRRGQDAEHRVFASEVPTFASGPGRVAGGETISKKTSTAALASFRHGLLPNQRRAPRHPSDLQGPQSEAVYAQSSRRKS